MIQSVSRALHLLEILARAGGSARLKEISETAALTVPTTHNLLNTLVALGYVRRRQGDTRYHLGDRILNIARVAGNDAQLRERLRPTLKKLYDATQETVFLAVPSGDEIYFLDAIESRKLLHVAAQPGERVGMTGSAIGQLFLAHNASLRARTDVPPGIRDELDRIARDGYAVDHERVFDGIAAVAVPLIEDGEMLAGFGVAAPGNRLTPDLFPSLAARMHQIIADHA